MPELPEVETVRRGLEPALVGRIITRAEARRPDLRWPLPERFAERLEGRRIEALARRSKYLLAHLDDGMTWLTHLGMSGRFTVFARDGGATTPLSETPGAFALAAQTAGDAGGGRHDHVLIETDAALLVYTDPRRFGAMDLWPTAEIETHPLLKSIGPEPLGNAFHVDSLAEALDGRSASIKSALLDQRRVAGLGNIYVCEALWRTGIDPRRAAGGISRKRVAELVDAIRAVLADAIEAGGSSLRDYRQATGDLGYFQHRFAVYDREDQPCAREGCKGVVQRVVQSGRSTFFCGRCQR